MAEVANLLDNSGTNCGCLMLKRFWMRASNPDQNQNVYVQNFFHSLEEIFDFSIKLSFVFVSFARMFTYQSIQIRELISFYPSLFLKHISHNQTKDKGRSIKGFSVIFGMLLPLDPLTDRLTCGLALRCHQTSSEVKIVKKKLTLN